MLSKLCKHFGGLLASSVLTAAVFTSASAQAQTTPATPATPASGPAADAKANNHATALPGELIVKFKADATDAQIQHGMKVGHLKVRRHLQTEVMRNKGHNGITQVETDLPIDEAIAQLKNHPAVDYVEPNYMYKHQAVSNDPYVTGNYTWGLYSALSSPANTYGSGASDAWSAGYTGTNGVYVAVIDEGIDYSHPELSGNVFNNPFDPPDGIDNDGNGYVDDVHGWNFYDGNNQIYGSATGDDHGTHVSGTIGARGGNSAGVAGVNWNVTILSGKFLGANGGDTLAAVEAIDYFVDMKKRHNLNLVAINASWGGGGYSQSLHDAIIRAAKAGIIFCAAAGNDSLNNDVTADYPANIDTRKGTTTETAASYDGVIAVAAIDSTGALASFSNCGLKTVHIGAPGVQILSTLPGNSYGYMSGTSMATPHVTGAVALYASSHPGASAQSIRDAILAAATPTSSLTGKTTTGGRLNIASIIKPAPVASAPTAPTGLKATAGAGSVTLTWTASSGATSYIVKRSTTVGGPYTTIATITTTSYTDTSVSNGAQYFYVVAAASSAGTSPNSTEVSATPQAAVTVAAPTGVIGSAAQATVAGNSTVTVRWPAVSGATSYQVKRATSSTGTYTTIATGLTSTSYSESLSAANNNVYYYRVDAVVNSTLSSDSAAATVATTSPAPSNMTSTALSSTQAQINWLDHSADEQGFKIEYWTGYAWSQIGTVAANATTATITGTSSRGTYYFRVRAYNGTLNTAYAPYTTITMP